MIPHTPVLHAGGNYALLSSPDGKDVTLVVETFTHATSKCVRNDPTDWTVAQQQTVTVNLPAAALTMAVATPTTLDVWRSCTGWRYPANDDGYMERLDPIMVSAAGAVTFTADRDCYYTLTTVKGAVKPSLPTSSAAAGNPRPAFFPLPYSEDFEGVTAGGEAPYFGDQEGKWETVPAGGGRQGKASQQQLKVEPWPILEPQCNDHGSPVSIIGDMFFESTSVTADVLVEEVEVGAGVGLRVRNPSSGKSFFRGVAPGLFLYVGATPGVAHNGGHVNEGGLVPPPNTPLAGWALCGDTYCNSVLRQGPMPAGSLAVIGHWHTITLSIKDDVASGAINATTIFSGVALGRSTPAPPSPGCVTNNSIVNTKVDVIVGGDYRQVVLPASGTLASNTKLCIKACCGDPDCTAWAVAKGKCWLKDHGWSVVKIANGGTEDAAGIKPAPDKPIAIIPSSGWAGIISTLGLSQIDNFKLEGTAEGGAAATPCGTAAPKQGALLVSTPCDYPGTTAGWTVSAGSDGTVRMAHTDDSAPLCIGTATVGGGADIPAGHFHAGPTAIALVDCSAASALRYNITTGQLSPIGTTGQCLATVQRQQNDLGAPALILTGCGGVPNDSQQFQYNPGTGALRPKGSSCIAETSGTVLNYRDCCLSYCPQTH